MGDNPQTSLDYGKQWEGTWGDLQVYGPQHRHKYRLILEMLRTVPFNTLLDVGCGAGRLLSLIRDSFPGCRLMGVDVSPTAVDRARNSQAGTRFEVLDISRERLDEQFDLVMCCDVLEHLEDDQQAIHNLRKMARAFALITVPRGRMRPSERLIGHLRNYQTSELTARLKEGGFDVLEYVEWGFPFYSPLYRLLQEWTTPAIGEGIWTWKRRTVAQIVYLLYHFNMRRYGDVLIVLARVAKEDE